MPIINVIFKIIFTSFSMFWEVLWPLILGFTLSAIIQAVVSHRTLAKTLGGNNSRNLITATLFGTASSSCSYAAVALARSLFQKGSSFTSAMVFQLASTNLVIELGIILIVLLGWQFMLAETCGAVIMIVILAVIFKFTLSKQLIANAKQHIAKGLQGKMEGHATMDMSVKNLTTHISKHKIQEILAAISQYFVMDIVAVWKDIVLGFLIAGMVTVLVPQTIWQLFFMTGNPTLRFIIGPLLGPVVAMLSFVCSVGNIPLAAVLWRGGMSFGGVISFIFADLIILPILDIYRKYYGPKMMLYLLSTFYITMVFSGYMVEIIFSIFHAVPVDRTITTITTHLQLNYTSYLNIIFLVLAVFLVYQFLKNDGPAMLTHMDHPMRDMHHEG